MRELTVGFFLLLAVILASCMDSERVEYSPAQTPPLRSIAIVTPAFRAEPHIFPPAGVASALLGPAGAAGAAAAEGRGAQYLSELKQRGILGKDLLLEPLFAALKGKSYAVSEVAAIRNDVEYLKSYPTLDGSGADAYLDVVVFAYGYYGTGLPTDFRPYIIVQFQLVDARTKKVIMKDRFAHTALALPKSYPRTEPAERYSFRGFDGLMSHMDDSIAGLRAGFQDVGTQIAARM